MLSIQTQAGVFREDEISCDKLNKEVLDETRETKDIYEIIGDLIPMQLIVTKELSAEENLWLTSLTDTLKDQSTAEKLIKEYGNHKENKLYKSMMNIIVHANEDTFQEVKSVCEALEELMKDELDARENKGLQEGRQKKLISLVCKKLMKGKTTPEIADALEESEDVIENICHAAAHFAPDYDVDKIYEELYGAK